MRLQSVFLANHATVADAMLYVLGGGASYLRRIDFPDYLGLYLCGFVDPLDALPSEPGALTVSMSVTVRPAGDVLILGTADAQLLFVVNPDGAPKTYGTVLPFAIDMRSVVLPSAGRYEVDVSLSADGIHDQAFVGFEAVLVDKSQITYVGDFERPAN